MAIWSNSPTLKHAKESSTPQHTAVGGGSRPTSSKHKIETSAPEDPRTLGRMVPGALGVGSPKPDVR